MTYREMTHDGSENFAAETVKCCLTGQNMAWEII